MFQRSLCILLAISILLAGAAVQAAPPAESRFEALDAYLETQRQSTHIQGMAIGVIEGNQVTHLRGFGVAGPSGEAVTPQTLFFLGSVSKGITALAVMQLVEAGKIKLDAPAKTYLPWFPAEDVTVRHLLNQTSGISTATGRLGMTQNDAAPGAILRSAQLAAQQPRTGPAGKAFEYSNANYILSGALIEAVTGKTYEEVVTEQIFKPLNMPLSFAHAINAGEQHMSSGYAQWWNFPFVLNAPYPGGHVPAGFLISSAEDMSHYLVAQLNAGVYSGRRILSAEGIATLHQGASPDLPGRGYAMGWQVVEREGLNAVEHSGDVANFHANVILLPAQKIGLVVLVNTNSTLNGEAINHLAWDAAHLLVGQNPVSLVTTPMLPLLAVVVIVLLALSIGLVAAGLMLLQRRRLGKSPRWWVVASVEIVACGIAWLTLLQMSALFGVNIPTMLLFSPDLALPALLSGVIAGFWALLFPTLLLAQRKRSRPLTG